MRAATIFVLSVLISGCSKDTDPRYDPGPPPPRSEIAQYVSHERAVTAFIDIYWKYEPNKAFASSDDGVYGYSASQMSSAEFAEKSALTYCELYKKDGTFPSPCKVVNVNGRWIDRPSR